MSYAMFHKPFDDPYLHYTLSIHATLTSAYQCNSLFFILRKIHS